MSVFKALNEFLRRRYNATETEFDLDVDAIAYEEYVAQAGRRADLVRYWDQALVERVVFQHEYGAIVVTAGGVTCSLPVPSEADLANFAARCAVTANTGGVIKVVASETAGPVQITFNSELWSATMPVILVGPPVVSND